MACKAIYSEYHIFDVGPYKGTEYGLIQVVGQLQREATPPSCAGAWEAATICPAPKS